MLLDSNVTRSASQYCSSRCQGPLCPAAHMTVMRRNTGGISSPAAVRCRCRKRARHASTDPARACCGGKDGTVAAHMLIVQRLQHAPIAMTAAAMRLCPLLPLPSLQALLALSLPCCCRTPRRRPRRAAATLSNAARSCCGNAEQCCAPVSYTHLTLPTIYSV
eukprot:TRINITY_DN7323_c1_g3_i1.p2 TRINITY_DN7323_c1_g3~~TRINITY_DN7323_c1_g3_i1.p2  ORF type:complete len:163 (+),score=14.33 TRINITY_DN7323_c1_g3_i1:416-904(+)